MKPEEYYRTCLNSLAPGATGEWDMIADAYQGRAYHNLDHLAEMVGHLNDGRLLKNFGPAPTVAPAPAPEKKPAVTRFKLQHPAIFGLALIYHDIVYQAGRKDNEARSADLAVVALARLGATANQQAYCRRLIMATKTHRAATDDEGLLVDLDLAVLARSANGYDAYTKAIRHEFRRYPGFLYRPGRRKALRHFLEQPSIYHHEFFRRRWEDAAKANLKRELKTL